MSHHDQLTASLALLSEAFAESRYHRQFHHTIFVLTMTLYVALFGGLFVNADKLTNLDTELKLLFSFVFFVFIPWLVTDLIIKYHYTIARLNAVIHGLGRHLGREHHADAYRLDLDSEAYAGFTFAKYGTAVGRRQNLFKTGRGHRFFIILIWTMFLSTATLFWVPFTGYQSRSSAQPQPAACPEPSPTATRQ